MTLQKIQDFILEKYPDSIFFMRYKGNCFQNSLVEEIIYFFYYEILNWCGCANPEDAIEAVYKQLKLYEFQRNYSSYSELEEYCLKEFGDKQYSDSNLALILGYVLDEKELTEHGSCVYASWLTDLGKMFLFALEIEYGNKNEFENN